MKIWIYAISKNEQKHVDRFVSSCAGVDGVSVLDTGSDDGTPERLRELLDDAWKRPAGDQQGMER